MRFSCDSCSAQYMISDDKVGPNGVKVRCKKCGHIVLVKRPPADASEPAAAPAPSAPPPGDGGLDAELGQAFDAMFGESKPEPKAEAAGDLAATQVVPPEELARLAGGAAANETRPSAGPAAPPAESTEWYVAIDDQQVGPLAPDAVKGKWESGEIGPDSLVWRPGMEDWKALSTVPALADMLAPVPRPQARPKVEAPAQGGPPRGVAPAGADAGWQPNAASALAALASEEMATLAKPEQKNGAPAAAKPAEGKGSLVDSMNLPDAGGIDPTGALPLTIKGMEPTGEAELKRKSSVARSAAEVRGRRSATRMIFAVVSVVAVAAAAAGGFFLYSTRKAEAPSPAAGAVPPSAQAPAPAPPAPPPLAAPAPMPPPAGPAVAQPAPQASVPLAPPAPPEVTPQAAQQPPQKPARPEPAAKQPARRRAQRVASVERTEPPPAPAPEPPKKKRGSGDPLLDFSGEGESDLEKELGSGSGKKRSVYVPPAPGSDLPSEISQAQIQEGVASRISGLRDCLGKQEAADPSLHGVLKIRWLIAGDGSVSGVRTLTPEFAKQPIAQCLTGVVKTIRFPRSRTTGQEVIFPFKF